MRKIFYILLLFGLAAFLAYPVIAQGQRIIARYTAQDIPLDPASDIWNSADAATIPLTTQIITLPFGGGAIPSVSVKALQNGKVIGFLIEWNDATKDDAVLVKKFRDAVAVQFPVGKEVSRLPSAFMGDGGNPVNIWQWRADWEADLGGENYADKAYPAYADYYNAQADAEFKDIGERAFAGSSVDDLTAKGFGTLTRQEQQNVKGKGVYYQGKWRVVFLRDMQTTDVNDAQFSVGEAKAINFAAWEGSKGEVGSKKSVSLVWHELLIEPREGMRIEEKKAAFSPLLAGLIIGFLAALGIATLALRRPVKR